jgi:2-oxoglutarate dehydrogenase E2 component (dihydrolipoamide succinyltransferase)
MIDILVPAEQEGTRAVVRAWLRQVGDRVELNDPLVELETDKVAMEVPAPATGVLREILLATDAEALPGSVLGRIAPEVDGPGAPAEAGARPNPGASPGHGPHHQLRLSPSVRRALLQHDIDPARVEGTGRDGRITRADVDRAVEAATRVQPDAKRLEGAVPSRSVPHDRMRLRIAENMLASVTEAPHVTAVFEADFSAIIRHRERHKAAFAARGAKLTYTAYILAAAAEAMDAAPAINGRWHEDRIEIFEDVNIGVGTALGEKGLIVPVLRRVQTLGLEEIAMGLHTLIERARSERLSAQDVSGGTFTVSNHGVSGSLFAAPIIINRPQAAILGIGKLEKRVVVREVDGSDSIAIRPMAYVSLSIDHRVVDGHQTNAWLTRFVDLIEGWPQD